MHPWDRWGRLPASRADTAAQTEMLPEMGAGRGDQPQLHGAIPAYICLQRPNDRCPCVGPACRSHRKRDGPTVDRPQCAAGTSKPCSTTAICGRWGKRRSISPAWPKECVMRHRAVCSERHRPGASAYCAASGARICTPASAQGRMHAHDGLGGQCTLRANANTLVALDFNPVKGMDAVQTSNGLTMINLPGTGKPALNDGPVPAHQAMDGHASHLLRACIRHGARQQHVAFMSSPGQARRNFTQISADAGTGIRVGYPWKTRAKKENSHGTYL